MLFKFYNVSTSFLCQYVCDEIFDIKEGVMKHWKSAHKEKVRQYIYFTAGKCNTGMTYYG